MRFGKHWLSTLERSQAGTAVNQRIRAPAIRRLAYPGRINGRINA